MPNFPSLTLNFQMQCNALNIKRLETAAKTSYNSVLYSQNYAAAITRTQPLSPLYHESSDCFENTKKSLLKSSHPRKCLQIFSFPKNPGVENFTPPKNLSVSPRHLKSVVPPPPRPDLGPQPYSKLFRSKIHRIIS